MSESSLFWTTGATGDGAAAYTQSQLFSWLSRGNIYDETFQAVIAGNQFGDSLEVLNFYSSPPTASPISVGRGAAYVCGIPYLNDASKSLAVSTPVVGTTGYRIILKADYTAQTVRLLLKGSADGTAALPALTQTANSVWEISLFSFTITTGGVIGNWADTRGLIYPPGNREYRRATNWGSTSGAPQPVTVRERQLVGQVNAPGSVVTAFTFPIAFSSTPIFIITSVGGTNTIGVVSVSATGFSLTNSSATTPVNYLAIGPV
jgi:hypothetical protein